MHVDNVKDTPGLVVDRCLAFRQDHGISKRRDDDGDMGTAAKHPSGKVELLDRMLGLFE